MTVTFPVVASTLVAPRTPATSISERRTTREGCRECRLDIATVVSVDILETDLALYRIGFTAVIEDEGHRLCSLLREDGL